MSAATDTIESAISELWNTHHNSDSTSHRKSLEELIERMYLLTGYVEGLEDRT